MPARVAAANGSTRKFMTISFSSLLARPILIAARKVLRHPARMPLLPNSIMSGFARQSSYNTTDRQGVARRLDGAR
jgi:hypothetical protein